jgi:flagellar biosynthesis protein FlhF
MKIKRFFAPDMKTALKQVREEQGADAVILSTRKVEGGMEIVSAIDYDHRLMAHEGGAESGMMQHQGLREDEGHISEKDLLEKPAISNIEWSQDPALLAMRQELNTLRELMQHQMEHLVGKKQLEQNPIHAPLMKKLGRLGVSESIASRVVAGVRSQTTEQGWREVLYGLASQINVMEDDIVNKGGMVALVGSTGVGKTTTIAKLAVRFSKRHGSQQLALVTTDNYRVGAENQLSIYGKILGVPVHKARTPDELLKLLKGLRDKKLILIDTAGLGQKDAPQQEMVQILNKIRQVRVYMVASASSQARMLDELITHYGRHQLHGCILTKLDEAAWLGDSLSVLIEQGIPLTYLSDGQSVPDHLKPAKVSSVVAQLMSTERADTSVKRGALRDNLTDRHRVAAVI